MVKPMSDNDYFLLLVVLGVFMLVGVAFIYAQPANGNPSDDTTISHTDPQSQKINLFKISEIEAIEDSGVSVCPICDDGVVLYVVKPAHFYDAAIGVYGTRDCYVVSKYCPDFTGACDM